MKPETNNQQKQFLRLIWRYLSNLSKIFWTDLCYEDTSLFLSFPLKPLKTELGAKQRHYNLSPIIRSCDTKRGYVYKVCNHVIAVYSKNKLQHYATAYRNHKRAGEKLGLFRFCKFLMYFVQQIHYSLFGNHFLTE